MFKCLLVTLTIVACCALAGPASHAQYLDITTLTTGQNGSFAGSIGGLPVSGAITIPTAQFFFTATGTTFDASTINNTSPQYSYSNIYTPSSPLTDRVGYNSLGGTRNTATIVVSFGAPVTNPVFHVANLDSMQYAFSLTGGLTGLTLLSGNGGGGDGLQVAGNVISDANTNTVIGVDPATPPPTVGARSGYGSVQLNGTFQVLNFTVDNPGLGGDGGSFTLSLAPAAPPPSVPEPGSIALLLGMGTVGTVFLRRRKNARKAD